MRCRRCSHELSSGADRCLRCFALNPQNVAGPLFAGLDSDPPKEVRVRFDDEPGPAERPAPIEKPPAPPKARKPQMPAPAPLLFVELLKTPAPPPPRLEPVTDPDPERQEPKARRFDPKTFLVAWAIDFSAVAALTALHVGLAVAVIGPERLAPGPAGSIDYWIDLFRGGGLWMFWLLLAVTLALAYCAVSALLLGRTPGLALATRESRLPPERSAP
ncbi:MAG: hypothetical protein E6J62_18735 [Deltaproteobacteria bacterium]|nr:MAG: hypothetical protein E6J85_11415 [Deltaproteobacteria bacterium]TMB27888.1 MAG: hypothetical protein E6J62_18735 [Deltaproteobacteria bacterium]TMB35501.1 MAG: hypothetical protein E6J61_01345 [Deltaproteobacteria bacterium]